MLIFSVLAVAKMTFARDLLACLSVSVTQEFGLLLD